MLQRALSISKVGLTAQSSQIACRRYAKKAKEEEETKLHIPTIEEVRRRAMMKKDAAKLKAQVQQDAMDPLIRQAYDELEDEDRIRRGLAPIHAHKYARKTPFKKRRQGAPGADLVGTMSE